MGRLKAFGSLIGAMDAKVRALPKLAEGFYSSPQWRALVADRKYDPDYQAARMRAKPGERLILDHVVERKDGGADLDALNTEWLTFSEHQVKTARARAARARGAGHGGLKPTVSCDFRGPVGSKGGGSQKLGTGRGSLPPLPPFRDFFLGGGDFGGRSFR